MASKVRSEEHSRSPPPARKPQVRQTVTLEMVQAAAPHGGLAENLSRTFRHRPGRLRRHPREATEEHMVRCANES